MHRVFSTLSLIVLLAPGLCLAQTASSLDQRIAAMEERLRAASEQLRALTGEIELLKNEKGRASVAPQAAQQPAPSPSSQPAPSSFAQQVLGTPTGGQELTRPIDAKPEIFVQSRYSAFPLAEATLSDYQPNFRVSRAAMRWAGSVNARWGAGIELQYRAAPDNVPEQLLNDAYVDYRATRAVTIRAGQFVKPFGFDVQQPDAQRESPERAMFAGYVFPGERDRGVMLLGSFTEPCRWFTGLEYAAAIVNGNRFFKDSNRQVNYLFRVRKPHGTLAYGASVQLGTQITPPGVAQTNDENVYGGDVQWTLGPLGVRGEFVHANRPSTFLASEPVFAPAFVEGVRVRTVGTSVTGLWAFTPERQAYLRFDRLAGDIVQLCPGQKDGSCKINAVNGGFRQRLGDRGFVGVDLQWKGRLSFNQDAVNTRLQITSNLVF